MSEPTIQFGVLGGFGDIDGWERQDSDGELGYPELELETTLDNVGNESASQTYGDDVSINTNYTAGSGATVSIPDEVGGIVNGVLNTSMAITTGATAKATLALSGHNHVNNAHVAGGCRTGLHGLVALNAFGATDFLDGTAGDNADILSGTWTAKCEHFDAPSKIGNHFKGENYHGQIDATTVWNGKPTTAMSDEWTQISFTPSEKNDGIIEWTAVGRKSFQLS